MPSVRQILPVCNLAYLSLRTPIYFGGIDCLPSIELFEPQAYLLPQGFARLKKPEPFSQDITLRQEPPFSHQSLNKRRKIRGDFCVHSAGYSVNLA